MVEAQYHQEDFDGIVAGAPAFPLTAAAAKFIRDSKDNYVCTIRVKYFSKLNTRCFP